MSKKRIFRVAKTSDNPYVMVDKGFLNHPQLSYRAKGILTYILSKPDHWSIQIHDLLKHGKEGRDAVYAGLKELITHGFIRRVSHRENGKVTAYEYIVYEQPHLVLSENTTGPSILLEPLSEENALCVSHTGPSLHSKTGQATPLPEKPPAHATHKNQEAAQSLDTPHLIPLPGKPDAEIQDPENPTQVIKDFRKNNTIIHNTSSHERVDCVIFELWKETFQKTLPESDYDRLIKASSRPLVTKTVCLIQQHHTVSQIQSPFAFVYTCVTNGGYSIPEVARKEAPSPRGSTLPKSVQAQLDGVSITPMYNEAEMKDRQARIEEKVREMEERRKAFRARGF